MGMGGLSMIAFGVTPAWTLEGETISCGWLYLSALIHTTQCYRVFVEAFRVSQVPVLPHRMLQVIWYGQDKQVCIRCYRTWHRFCIHLPIDRLHIQSWHHVRRSRQLIQVELTAVKTSAIAGIGKGSKFFSYLIPSSYLFWNHMSLTARCTIMCLYGPRRQRSPLALISCWVV